MVKVRNFTISLRSVVRYNTSQLSNKCFSDGSGFDKVVLDRWDRFKKRGSVRADMDNIKERMVEVMILCPSLHTKLALNFLCAYSIVSHQYWHLYHTRLVVQSLPLAPWSDMPYCTLTGQEYPALGWVWLSKEEGLGRLDQVAEGVARYYWCYALNRGNTQRVCPGHVLQFGAEGELDRDVDEDKQ